MTLTAQISPPRQLVLQYLSPRFRSVPRFVPGTTSVLVALSIFATTLAADESRAVETEAMIIMEDTKLDPAKRYSRIVIAASDITIDGNGATLIGASEGDPKDYRGVAIEAEGIDRVVLRNVRAKGFETGLRIARGTGWTIEGCDFSDNFHDPRFGWGENGRRGGILLERVTASTLRRTRANRVWDACVLIDSSDNTIEQNDFSRTSNTCLKMWSSSRNNVRDNNLSWGLRKDPGEVHARDSTCVLIESGSNDNRLTRNDCTNGGDGIFIRVLNGWVSTGNVFEENDCSFANNNCVEAWSPRNTWIRNKANHGSYGFWLGASDQNVLIENEASFNGLPGGHHNSPHLPGEGHAGIVFMFGPSSHTVLRGNRCEGNNGAGIAAIGDQESKGKAWKAFHWVVDQNVLSRNRWGIYLQHADFIDLGRNGFEENSVSDVEIVENVTRLIDHSVEEDVSGAPRGAAPGRHAPRVRVPEARLDGPIVARVGRETVFDATKSFDPDGNSLGYRWELAPGVEATTERVSHVYSSPGFYRVALTVTNGALSDLAFRDLYVVDERTEIETEGALDRWSVVENDSRAEFSVDLETKLIGTSSLRARISPYSGGRATIRFAFPTPAALTDPISGAKQGIVFWLRTRNESFTGWQDLNPIVTLYGEDGSTLRLVPHRDLLSRPPYIEAREGWLRVAPPISGDTEWKSEGDLQGSVSSIGLGFDSWDAPPLVVWVDGLGWE
jgi:parallel beta-helix repeat protein